MSNAIIKAIKQEIARHDVAANWINYQQFFKEKLKEPYGLKASVLRSISSRLFKQVRGWSKDEILDLGDELLASNMRYARFFAFEWAGKVSSKYEPSDFKRFENWLVKYVDNWGACDSLCCGPIGQMLLKFPELAFKRAKWISSKNRWRRRAAAVALIVPVRKGLLLDEVFQTADALLVDDDDMVQKGYGWMLKEAGNRFPDDVFDYVMKNKAIMPRTALRYAIEKFAAARRKMAMSR